MIKVTVLSVEKLLGLTDSGLRNVLNIGFAGLVGRHNEFEFTV